MNAVSILRVPALLSGLLLPLQVCAFVYSADSIEGSVVDADTDKPIEGVIVVAHWELRGGLEGGTPIGQVQIVETTTDGAGRYFIPSWGPRVALLGQMRNSSPGIFLFHRGYRYRELDNAFYVDRDMRKSDWNKKAIPLTKAAGSLLEQSRELQRLSDRLWLVGRNSGEPCGWQAFPRMLLALASIDTQLQGSGAPLTVHARLKHDQENLTSKGCGLVDEVVRP